METPGDMSSCLNLLAPENEKGGASCAPGWAPKRKADAGDILCEVSDISHETLNARHIRQMAWAREYDAN